MGRPQVQQYGWDRVTPITEDSGSSTPTSWTRLQHAMGATSEQLVGLLRSVRNPEARAVGEWSIRDLAVHLADTYTNYALYLRGQGELFSDPSEITAHNARVVRAGHAMPVEEAAERIASSSAELARLVGQRRPDERVRWHGGIELDMSGFVAIPLSDAMIHAHDIAASEGRSFKPDPSHASATFANLTQLFPYYVDPSAAAGFSASYDLRLRGGDQRFLVFDNGGLEIATEPHPADCVISTDAFTFMLIGYNRISQWRPVLTGKVMAWGRKPWLGLKLPRLMAPP